ncbi:hypothetical protein I6E29_04385 [Arcanobacterium haemolyticum]|nr:hypothetical protein [Arcanobacterium haemolyticum]
MSFDLALFPGLRELDSSLVRARAQSVALRLLAGSGRAHMVAYRSTPLEEYDFIAHGLTAAGELVVAVPREACAGSRTIGTPDLDVRFSIEKMAPEASVSIVASSLHLLGLANWHTDESAQAFVAHNQCTPLIESIVADGGAIAIITFDRLLLHDSAGVTPLAEAAIVERWGSIRAERGSYRPFDEYSAVELIACAQLIDSPAIIDSLMLGNIAGAMLTSQSTAGLLDEALGMVCVDIDHTGVTFMYIDTDEANTVFIPFTRAVYSMLELQTELAKLRACVSIPMYI